MALIWHYLIANRYIYDKLMKDLVTNKGNKNTLN